MLFDSPSAGVVIGVQTEDSVLVLFLRSIELKIRPSCRYINQI
jgi:hypothetical protein